MGAIERWGSSQALTAVASTWLLMTRAGAGGALLCRNEMMADLARSNHRGQKIGLCAALAAASLLGTVPAHNRAMAEDDVFQQAVNYVFTGRIDPPDAPEIVDRKACVVVVPDTKFKRYIRYYLKRFKMDASRINTTYAGAQSMYELEVGGDDTVIEFLSIDKTKVDFGFKTAHISLPGNIDQSQRALRRIFDDYCKPEKPKLPF